MLRHVTRACPDQDLHLVMDNNSAHKHANVKAWLTANPRVHVDFTPTHASWMNMVEDWFSLADRQAIHRGSYRSVRELNTPQGHRSESTNDRTCPPTMNSTGCAPNSTQHYATAQTRPARPSSQLLSLRFESKGEIKFGRRSGSGRQAAKPSPGFATSAVRWAVGGSNPRMDQKWTQGP